jgi:hypothetical protein
LINRDGECFTTCAVKHDDIVGIAGSASDNDACPGVRVGPDVGADYGGG